MIPSEHRQERDCTDCTAVSQSIDDLVRETAAEILREQAPGPFMCIPCLVRQVHNVHGSCSPSRSTLVAFRAPPLSTSWMTTSGLEVPPTIGLRIASTLRSGTSASPRAPSWLYRPKAAGR